MGIGRIVSLKHRHGPALDLLRKSGEFPVSNEKLDHAATTVYDRI
jgi:hypothetical protein